MKEQASIPTAILKDARRLNAIEIVQDGRTYRAILENGQAIKLGKAKRCNKGKIDARRAFA